MNILITGGAGFIGSHLAERLVELGNHVVVLDDLSNGRTDYIQHLQNSPQFQFVNGSVLDASLLKPLIEQCDVIYHLAAVLGVKNTVQDPLKVIEGNIDGTRQILSLAHAHRKKVIFASTSEVYGKNNQLPFHENSDRVLGAPSVHRWCYATAKAIDEHLCFAYSDKGLPITVVRLFNVYGPRQTYSQYGGVIPRFITAALTGKPLTIHGDGSQTRCFTYVDDIVSGLVAALSPNANGLAFNLGSEFMIAIRGLANKILQLAGKSVPIQFVPYEEAYGPGFEDTPARIPDLTRSRTILGYHPSIPLDVGLKQTIRWYANELGGGGKFAAEKEK